MEFADRMGSLREELAIGLGIGKPMLSGGEREEPGAVARMMTGRRRDNDDNDYGDTIYRTSGTIQARGSAGASMSTTRRPRGPRGGFVLADGPSCGCVPE